MIWQYVRRVRVKKPGNVKDWVVRLVESPFDKERKIFRGKPDTNVTSAAFGTQLQVLLRSGKKICFGRKKPASRTFSQKQKHLLLATVCRNETEKQKKFEQITAKQKQEKQSKKLEIEQNVQMETLCQKNSNKMAKWKLNETEQIEIWLKLVGISYITSYKQT